MKENSRAQRRTGPGGRFPDVDRDLHSEGLEEENIFIYAMRYADESELKRFIEWLKDNGILTEVKEDG